MKTRAILLLLILGGVIFAVYNLNQTLAYGGETRGDLIPIGASYQDATLGRFVESVAEYDTDDELNIIILYPTYSTHPYTITAKERALNLSDATFRVGTLTDACQATVTTPTICNVSFIDIQVRADAMSPTLTAGLDASVDGVYVLGGDQQVAMLVIANTPLETALETLHYAGVPFGGNSAGAAIQSRYMIAGYADADGNGSEDFWPWDGLQYGTVDLWYGADNEDRRGLSYGASNTIVDQHVLERGRILRLLQAVEQSPEQHVGLGVDWGTGVVIQEGTIVTQTAGWYAGIILDQETYGSANRATYRGAQQTLSIQDVAFHILPEGNYGYDLDTLLPVGETSAPDISGRNYDHLTAPEGAGPLLLTGDLWDNPTGTVTSQFASYASGGQVTVLALGYTTASVGLDDASTWAGHLASVGVTNTATAVLTPSTTLTTVTNWVDASDAFFIIAGNQAVLADHVAVLRALGADSVLGGAWLSGTPMLFDGVASTAVGQWMTAEDTPTSIDIYASDSFYADYTNIVTGMGWISNTAFEAQTFYNYYYGRLVNHLYQHPDMIAVGLARQMALQITSDDVQVLGENGVLVLDGRYTQTLEEGTNGTIATTWILADTFAPQDSLLTPYQTFLPIIQTP